MGLTPIYNLRYQDASEPADGVAATKDLADTTEAALSGLAALVATRIAEITLTGTSATLDFTSIPSTPYRDLRLALYGRFDIVATSAAVFGTFNGDAGPNYDYDLFSITNGVVGAQEGFGSAGMDLGGLPAASAPANAFGLLVIDIPAYAQTVGHKIALSRGTVKTASATAGVAEFMPGNHWRSTAAINRITLFPNVTGNFIAGTRATLYGLP